MKQLQVWCCGRICRTLVRPLRALILFQGIGTVSQAQHPDVGDRCEVEEAALSKISGQRALLRLVPKGDISSDLLLEEEERELRVLEEAPFHRFRQVSTAELH